MLRLRHMLRRLLPVLVVCASLVSPPPTLAAMSFKITLDPGHGGSQIGASYRFADGMVLQEKALTLRVALRLGDLLRQAGYVVTLTRTTDALVNAPGHDVNGDGRVSLADDLQARVDMANQAGSELFVAIHFNGSSDPSMRGTYTFWNANRPFAERSRTLAVDVQGNILAALGGAGYTSPDRGARTDAWLLGGDAFFVLGPRSGTITRPSQMPAIIAEPLFLTNPQDAAALRENKIVDAVAGGLFDGIRAYATGQRPARTTTPSSAPPVLLHSAAALPSRSVWTVWAVTYQDTPKGRRLSTQTLLTLRAQGIPGSVISAAPSIPSRSNYLVVTSGAFDTRVAASAHATHLHQAGYPDAFVRSVGR